MKPKPEDRAPDEPPHYLVQKVREALAHDPRVSELELKVKIAGTKAFVTGVIHTKDRCESITEVVQEALPGFEVHNEVQVASLGEPAEAEHLQ